MTLSVASSPYTVTTAAQKVSPTTAVNSYSLIIQNNHSTNILYIGASNAVTSSAYGVLLAGGASIALDDLNPTDQIWVIASAAATPVGVMAVIR
jgi:hypothetical protein